MVDQEELWELTHELNFGDEYKRYILHDLITKLSIPQYKCRILLRFIKQHYAYRLVKARSRFMPTEICNAGSEERYANLTRAQVFDIGEAQSFIVPILSKQVGLDKNATIYNIDQVYLLGQLYEIAYIAKPDVRSNVNKLINIAKTQLNMHIEDISDLLNILIDLGLIYVTEDLRVFVAFNEELRQELLSKPKSLRFPLETTDECFKMKSDKIYDDATVAATLAFTKLSDKLPDHRSEIMVALSDFVSEINKRRA